MNPTIHPRGDAYPNHSQMQGQLQGGPKDEGSAGRLGNPIFDAYMQGNPMQQQMHGGPGAFPSDYPHDQGW